MYDRPPFAQAGLTCIDIVQRGSDHRSLGAAAAIVYSMCQGAVFLLWARGGPPGMKLSCPGRRHQPARSAEQPGQPSVARVTCAHAASQTPL